MRSLRCLHRCLPEAQPPAGGLDAHNQLSSDLHAEFARLAHTIEAATAVGDGASAPAAADLGALAEQLAALQRKVAEAQGNSLTSERTPAPANTAEAGPSEADTAGASSSKGAAARPSGGEAAGRASPPARAGGNVSFKVDEQPVTTPSKVSDGYASSDIDDATTPERKLAGAPSDEGPIDSPGSPRPQGHRRGWSDGSALDGDGGVEMDAIDVEEPDVIFQEEESVWGAVCRSFPRNNRPTDRGSSPRFDMRGMLAQLRRRR